MDTALKRLREFRRTGKLTNEPYVVPWVHSDLVQCTSMPEIELVSPDSLPSEWRIEWEECAAIREYDGHQAREHAEAEALREIIDRMEAGDG